jgi:endonuclease/exonuclease/phosphatase (EEP) superfamily protein YafD
MIKLWTSWESLGRPDSRLHGAMLVRARVLVVVSGLATLLGALGSVYWRFELLSHFVAWQAMLTGLAFVMLLSIRRWPWVLVAFIVLAFQAYMPLSWYFSGSASPAKANCRLLLANVLTSNLDKQSFLDLVSATNPDAICVQEADDAWGDALKSLEQRYPIHAIVPRSDNFGIAFYTRLPGIMSGVLFQREHDVPALAATVEVEGRRFSILDVHAVPPLGTVMAERRNQHLSAIRAWIEAQSDPVILLGDLNLTMYSPEYRRFTRGLGLQNARQGFGPLGTWPTWVPFARLPLDQCLLRGDLAVVSCASGPDIGSDHLPLIVDLYIAPN